MHARVGRIFCQHEVGPGIEVGLGVEVGPRLGFVERLCCCLERLELVAAVGDVWLGWDRSFGDRLIWVGGSRMDP